MTHDPTDVEALRDRLAGVARVEPDSVTGWFAEASIGSRVLTGCGETAHSAVAALLDAVHTETEASRKRAHDGGLVMTRLVEALAPLRDDG